MDLPRSDLVSSSPTQLDTGPCLRRTYAINRTRRIGSLRGDDATLGLDSDRPPSEIYGGRRALGASAVIRT